MPILYVETNFPMAIAKGQDPDAENLLVNVPSPIRLIFPSICYMEASSVLRSEFKQRRRFIAELEAQITETKRNLISPRARRLFDHLQSSQIESLDFMSELQICLYLALEGLSKISEMIHLDPYAIQESLTSQYIEDPTDNLILCSILGHARSAPPGLKAFLSANSNDFGRPDAIKALNAVGVKYFKRTGAALGWLRAQPGSLRSGSAILRSLGDEGSPRDRTRGSIGWVAMPNRRKAHLDALEDRLTGPKRIALFGHRNVGKTTLLAMFYRQASTGQVPGLRLAAADPASAEYLAEKIAQIESGEPPAGTLAETELKLRLYHGAGAVRPDRQGLPGRARHARLRRADPGILRRLRRRAALPRPRGLGQPGRPAAAAAGGRGPARAVHRALRRQDHRPPRRAAADEVRPRPGPILSAGRPRARRRPDELGRRAAGRVPVRDDPARPGAARAARGDLRGQRLRPGGGRTAGPPPSCTRSAWRGRSAGSPSSSRPATASSSNGSGTSPPTTCPASRGASPPSSGAIPGRTARPSSARGSRRSGGAEPGGCWPAWRRPRRSRRRRWPATTPGATPAPWRSSGTTPRPPWPGAGPSCCAWHPSLALFWPGPRRQRPAEAGRVDGQGGRGPGRERHGRPRPPPAARRA